MYMNEVLKEVKRTMGRENGSAEGRERRLTDLLYADDLILCGESNEDLRVTIRGFVEV